MAGRPAGEVGIAALSFKAHLTHTSCLNQTKNITQKHKIPTDAQTEETTFSLSPWPQTSLSAQRCSWCQQLQGLQAETALFFLWNVTRQYMLKIPRAALYCEPQAHSCRWKVLQETFKSGFILLSVVKIARPGAFRQSCEGPSRGEGQLMGERVVDWREG